MGGGGTYRLKTQRFRAKIRMNKDGTGTVVKQMEYEHELQAQVIIWAKRNEDIYPELWLLHAIPNGGKRDVTVAKKLRAEGVKPGVPDLFLPAARNGYHGLYIEMKSADGRLQKSQKTFQKRLIEQNYKIITCYSAEEAILSIRQYLKPGEDNGIKN